MALFDDPAVTFDDASATFEDAGAAAGLRLWSRGGKIIRDASGRLILCDECPCETGTGTGTGTAGFFDLATGTGTNERGVLAGNCCPNTYIPGHLYLTYECITDCSICFADFVGGAYDFSTNPLLTFFLIYRGEGTDASYPGTPTPFWRVDEFFDWDGQAIGLLRCTTSGSFALLAPLSDMTYSPPEPPDVFVCDPFYIEWSNVGANAGDCGALMRFRITVSELPP